MKKLIVKNLALLIVALLIVCCQKDDVVVQSLFDLSGAPLKYDDSKATRFLHVAADCLEPSKEKAENVKRILQTCRKVKTEFPATELILFPETILGWYIDDQDPKAYQLSVAEPVPGPVTDTISYLADSLNVYVAFGVAEKKDNQLFNSQVLINPHGVIEAVHRKITLTPEDEKSGFTPGNKTAENVTVVTINHIKVGMIICADVSGYWLTKQLTDRKVEIILHSMASEVAEFFIDPVGRQYNAWEVFANRNGKEGSHTYSGTTFISDPVGNIRVSGSGKETVKTYKIGVR